MQIYLVGGAVRDKLLNRKTVDKDYVVTGATAREMLDNGFKQVGKDFPVFLHPKTNDEYALARTERKKGQGHKGFECDASPHITLEQDLLRRDLTINAMAMDDDGKIVDPYGGKQDLQNKLLRHVSAAFNEDPLRVFRVARFAARFAELGFTVDDSTMALMQKIANAGELRTLSANRVWQETARSLVDTTPDVYFSVLHEISGLTDWFAELQRALDTSVKPAKVDDSANTQTKHHTTNLTVLKAACKQSSSLSFRYAALTQDIYHAGISHDAIIRLSERLGVPNECRALASMTNKHHAFVHTLYQHSPQDIFDMLNAIDVWRKPDRFKQFLLLCKTDNSVSSPLATTKYPQMNLLTDMYERCACVAAKPFVDAGLKGIEIKNAINRARLVIIRELLEKVSN